MYATISAQTSQSANGAELQEAIEAQKLMKAKIEALQTENQLAQDQITQSDAEQATLGLQIKLYQTQ